MTLDDFLPFIFDDVPGAPSGACRRALLFTAMEFCIDTKVWNELLDPITLIDRTSTYDIDTPDGAAVASILGAWRPDGQPMTPANIQSLDALLPGWQQATGPTPLFYNQPNDEAVLRIYPTPLNAMRAKFTVRVAYRPTTDAETLPDRLAGENLEALACGTKARLMAQPGKPWSNPAMAQFFASRYTQARMDAKLNQLKDGAPAPIVVRPGRPFGF